MERNEEMSPHPDRKSVPDQWKKHLYVCLSEPMWLLSILRAKKRCFGALRDQRTAALLENSSQTGNFECLSQAFQLHYTRELGNPLVLLNSVYWHLYWFVTGFSLIISWRLASTYFIKMLMLKCIMVNNQKTLGVQSHFVLIALNSLCLLLIDIFLFLGTRQWTWNPLDQGGFEFWEL